MNPESLEKLKKKILAIDEAVTMQELSQAIDALLTFAKKLEGKTEKDLETIIEYAKSALERVQSTISDTTSKSEQKLMSKLDSTLNTILLEHESRMAEVDKRMEEVRDGEDGLDADEDEIIAKILPQLPQPKEPELTQKDKVELQREINTLKEKIANTRTAPFIGPSRGMFLYINGVKKGLVNSLNVEGDGVSTSVVNGLLTLTIAGGTGTMVDDETPTGTINGTNDTFTLGHTPTAGSVKLYLNGARLRVTEDYTISGATITFIIPPLTGSILLADYRY